MVIVGTENFVGEGNKNYLLMSNNDQYIRRFNFRNYAWTYAKIGILMSIQGNTSFTGGLLVGLTTSANGEGIGYKQGQGAGVVRGVYGGTGIYGVNWGYSGTGYNIIPYSSDAGGGRFGSNLCYAGAYSGGTRVGNAGNTTQLYVPSTESVARKGVYMLGLYRSNATTVNVSFGGMNTYTGGSNKNYSDNSLITALQMNSPAMDGNGLTFPPSTTLSTNDDALYPLDTINVLWTGSVPMRLYSVMMAQLR